MSVNHVSESAPAPCRLRIKRSVMERLDKIGSGRKIKAGVGISRCRVVREIVGIATGIYPAEKRITRPVDVDPVGPLPDMAVQVFDAIETVCDTHAVRIVNRSTPIPKSNGQPG